MKVAGTTADTGDGAEGLAVASGPSQMLLVTVRARKADTLVSVLVTRILCGCDPGGPEHKLRILNTLTCS